MMFSAAVGQGAYMNGEKIFLISSHALEPLLTTKNTETDLLT